MWNWDISYTLVTESRMITYYVLNNNISLSVPHSSHGTWVSTVELRKLGNYLRVDLFLMPLRHQKKGYFHIFWGCGIIF